MRRYGVPVLRLALGLVFLWFGALKIFGVTPVTELIQATYHFFPTENFIFILGIWEVLIGLGLLFRVYLRTTLGLLWLQMLGTIVATFLAPHLFFTNNNPFLLTMNGEFIVKNLVLIAAGLVIGGFDSKLSKSS